jgi:pimeloyl-ACP methyl ester carboxylesterase
MTPVVLVHGGGFAADCWDLVLDHLKGEALAVDLPGRGAHPAPLETITLASAAASVAADVDAAGLADIVLVGHSLAGCTMPGVIGLLGGRVSHAVFVACTVPPDGASSFDTLDPEFQAQVRAAGLPAKPDVLDPGIAKVIFGNDLDDEQFAWCVERMVPEAPGLLTEPVDLSPLRGTKPPRTWVRTLQDAIIHPDKQIRFAEHVGSCRMMDLDAAHMCMISKPMELAMVLNAIAAAA